MKRHMMMIVALLSVPGLVLAQEGEPDSLEEADAAVEKAFEKDRTVIPEEMVVVEPQVGKDLRFKSAAPGGETGLMRVMEAGSTDPMTIKLSLHGGFFSSSGTDGFLNYLDADDYSESQVVGRLGLAFTPLSFLEVFASYRNSSNKNSISRPGLLQTQGDMEFGAKGFYPVLPFLSVGLNLGIGFYNGIGEVTPDLAGTTVRTGLLLSFDARKIEFDTHVPVRFHVNVGLTFENTDNLQGNRDLTYVEQYALRVNSYNRLGLGFGLDAPLPYVDPVAITPYLEYSMQIPLGVGDEELADSSMGTDASLSSVMPMFLTPGVRVTYQRDITFDFAVDIGIGGKKAYLDGVPSTPPYTVWFGLSYVFDPTKRGEEKTIEKIVEKEKIVEVDKGVVAPVTTGRIKGRVVNAVDQTPVAAAIISFSGSDITPVATEPMEGRYETYNLTIGMVKLTASRDGFKAVSREAEVKAGEVALLDFALEPEAERGIVSGKVFNEKDRPMLAKIDINGPGEFHLDTSADTGEFSSPVPEGSYVVKASAEGYLARARRFEIKKDKTVMAEFKLVPAPKKTVVIIEKDKIVVKKKIHFATGRAEIRTDSHIILDAVIDVLANHPEIRKIRVEGHTDSMGSDASNKRLSQKRAHAVMDYLIKQGILGDMLVARGYGETMPVAPNNTRRGREQNRRVAFTILER
jgi:outer membrane protein OmpA-like peptidoglycan-associated protein